MEFDDPFNLLHVAVIHTVLYPMHHVFHSKSIYTHTLISSYTGAKVQPKSDHARSLYVDFGFNLKRIYIL